MNDEYTYVEKEKAIDKASEQNWLETQSKIVELRAKLILIEKEKKEWASEHKEKQKYLVELERKIAQRGAEVKKKERNLLVKQRALDSGLFRISDVEEKLLLLQKKLSFYENNAPKKIVKKANEDYSEPLKKRPVYLTQAHELLEIKKIYDFDIAKYNQLLQKYNELVEDTEKMPEIDSDIMNSMQERFLALEKEIQEERLEKNFYKSKCDPKIVENRENLTKSIIDRRSLGKIKKNPELNKKSEIINKHKDQKQILTIFKPKVVKSKKNKSKRS